MKPAFYVQLLVSPINFFLQWLLVWSPLNVGVVGAPLAVSITNIISPIFLIVYIRKYHDNRCWGGWDLSQAFDLKQLWVYIKLGIPGVLMICSEW